MLREKDSELRWSRYNFLVENNRGIFLYNSYSNCLLHLDSDMAEACRKIRDNAMISMQTCLSEEEIEYFAENKILVEDDDDLVESLHLHSMARLFTNKSFVLTIAPTQSCNFACSYCYEHFRSSEPMTDKTAQSIVDFIKQLHDSNGLEVLYLTWYGGEPLLQLQRVCSLSKQLRNLSISIKENSIITNGYCLTKNAAQELIGAGIDEIQITLDGSRKTHNQRRPLVSGEGSYDRIVENLDSFFFNDFDEDVLLSIRVNIDRDNCEEYVETYQWLKDRYKGHRLIVYPGVIVIDDGNPCSRLCMGRDDVTDMYIKLYKEYGIVSERLYPDDINIECKARSPYGNMLIGSQGEIYKCFEDLGNPAKVVGNINDTIKWSNFKEIARYATGIDHYLTAECRECPYLPICNGGCPIRRYENVYCGKHNDCCTPFKGRISDYIDMVLES